MAEDKFGTEIAEGDLVEFFYGGDRHEATVDAVASGPEAISYLTVTPEPIEIPAGQVRVVEKAEKKSSHKSSTKGSK